MNIYCIYQAVKQVLGLMYIAIRYENSLPLPENYELKAKYILPFEGSWTVVNGGVTEEFSHSWDVLTQRFAYDFLIVDENRNSYSGDLSNPKNYFCYGVNILSPADGEVVHIEDRCSDSIIDGEKARCNSRDICGNHIIIKHADGEYSMLAHLMKDSITVEVGDRVHQGQRIAKCGNTGNSSEPHLHFHVQHKKNFFTALGLPVSFTGVKMKAKENYGMIDPRKAQDGYIEVAGKQYIGRGQEVSNGNDI